jgi:hypothetical protein
MCCTACPHPISSISSLPVSPLCTHATRCAHTYPFVISARSQAAALSRTGQLLLVNASCPSAAMSRDGMVLVAAPPAKVYCNFSIDGLPPMDGFVLPVVYSPADKSVPLPAEPGMFKLSASSPRSIIGECVQVGSSRALTPAGGGSAIPGQPVRKSMGLPSTPLCRTTRARYDLVFGPFSPTACGSYSFTSDLSADLTNTPAWERKEQTFGVQVTGC